MFLLANALAPAAKVVEHTAFMAIGTEATIKMTQTEKLPVKLFSLTNTTTIIIIIINNADIINNKKDTLINNFCKLPPCPNEVFMLNILL